MERRSGIFENNHKAMQLLAKWWGTDTYRYKNTSSFWNWILPTKYACQPLCKASHLHFNLTWPDIQLNPDWFQSISINTIIVRWKNNVTLLIFGLYGIRRILHSNWTTTTKNVLKILNFKGEYWPLTSIFYNGYHLLYIQSYINYPTWHRYHWNKPLQNTGLDNFILYLGQRLRLQRQHQSLTNSTQTTI